MATTVYETVVGTPDWDIPGLASAYGDSSVVSSFNPFPAPGGVSAQYINKCVDGITGNWSFWKTFFQDRTGVYYSQSTEGQQFDAGTYKVQAIRYDREQS